MGRIKTQMVKSASHEIMKRHRAKFTTEFQKNKEILSQVADLPSKKIRNIIAGYITRLMKNPE